MKRCRIVLCDVAPAVSSRVAGDDRPAQSPSLVESGDDGRRQRGSLEALHIRFEMTDTARTDDDTVSQFRREAAVMHQPPESGIRRRDRF